MKNENRNEENSRPVTDISEKFRRVIVDDMADTIKRVSQTGQWSEPSPEITEDMPPDQLVRATMEAAAKAMTGDIPLWFSSSASAMRSVLSEDETLGLDCAAALYEATQKASSVQRLDALKLLLENISKPSNGASAFGLLGRY